MRSVKYYFNFSLSRNNLVIVTCCCFTILNRHFLFQLKDKLSTANRLHKARYKFSFVSLPSSLYMIERHRIQIKS